jgi:hypothetical protein
MIPFIGRVIIWQFYATFQYSLFSKESSIHNMKFSTSFLSTRYFILGTVVVVVVFIVVEFLQHLINDKAHKYYPSSVDSNLFDVKQMFHFSVKARIKSYSASAAWFVFMRSL